MSALICIPTYNEAENITTLLSAILDMDLNAEIVVIDDNSPDNTAATARKFCEKHPSGNLVNIITRSEKKGRGAAVWFGVKCCMRREHETIIEMDADFSHSPTYLLRGIRLIKKGNDLVIAARYPNGSIINWPTSRRIFSFFANLLARVLLSWKIHDYTNGYRFYSYNAASLLCASEMKEDGYINLSETLSICLRQGLLITSFPIVFVNRNKGKSNTSIREIAKSLIALCRISYHHHTIKKP